MATPANPLLNMSPITIGSSYKDPRANVLYGGGNSKISDNEIASYVSNARNSGTMSEKDLVDKAIANGVSIDQFARATGMNVNDVAKAAGQYVSNERSGPAVTLDMAQILAPVMDQINGVKAQQVKPTNVALNPATDTVQGQLGSILQDPNNPLMVRAGAMGDQAANRRGLLNSSIGVSAGQSALTDAALQIATPDAQTFSNAKFANAQAANNASLENARNKLTGDMFSSDMAFKVGSTNAQNQLDANKFNAQNINSVVSQTLGQYMDNENRVKLAKIEAETQGRSNFANIYNNIASKLIDVLQSDSPNKKQIVDDALTLLQGAANLDKAGDSLGLDKLFSSPKETPANAANSGSLLNTQTPANNGASVLSGQRLGQFPGNPDAFETIGGTIPTSAANVLKNAGYDPRFVLTGDHLMMIGLTPTSASVMANRPDSNPLQIDPFPKINPNALRQKLADGLKNGTIQRVVVRDPKTGMPLDQSFAAFDQPDLYYDPNNILGLAS